MSQLYGVNKSPKVQNWVFLYITYALELVIHWISYIIFQKYKYSCCCRSIHSCWLPDDSRSVGRRSRGSLANNNYQAVTWDLMIEFSFPPMCTYFKQNEKKRAGWNSFAGDRTAGSDDGLEEYYERETEAFLPTYGVILESLKRVSEERTLLLLCCSCRNVTCQFISSIPINSQYRKCHTV